MSQAALAREAMTSQATIDRIERGVTKASIAMLRVLGVLGIKLEEIDAIDKFGRTVNFGKVDYLREYLDGTHAISSMLTSNKSELVGDIPIYNTEELVNGRINLLPKPMDFLKTSSSIFKSITLSYALLMSGFSMYPVYEPGDLLLLDAVSAPRPHNDVLLRGNERKRKEAMLAHLVSWNDDTWNVRQWLSKAAREGVPTPIEIDRKAFPQAHRVVGRFILA